MPEWSDRIVINHYDDVTFHVINGNCEHGQVLDAWLKANSSGVAWLEDKTTGYRSSMITSRVLPEQYPRFLLIQFNAALFKLKFS